MADIMFFMNVKEYRFDVEKMDEKRLQEEFVRLTSGIKGYQQSLSEDKIIADLLPKQDEGSQEEVKMLVNTYEEAISEFKELLNILKQEMNHR